MSGDHWQHFRPAGGIGLRGIGLSKERAFEQVGLALTATITDPAEVRLRGLERIRCTAPDDQALLLAWIETLLGRMAVHHLMFGQYRVSIAEHVLDARALGEPLEPSRIDPGLDLHRVLCEQLQLFQEPGGKWQADVILRPRGVQPIEW